MNTAPLLRPLRALANKTVVVGVSGGADSVGLLRALLLAEVKPVVAHLDHALREGSAADAAWVAALAARFGLPYESVRVEVGAVAKRRGWNLEDAARRLRYDFLTRSAKKHGAELILTAHTQRDQAETVLMQLLRGEAVLSGIPAHRGRVRRPWLGVSRQQIEDFLAGLGQEWREDPTNQDTAYTRAWLRREVTPVLSARYPALEASLGRLAHFAAQDDQALGQVAGQIRRHTPLPKQPAAVIRRWVKGELQAQQLTVHAGQLQTLTEALQAANQTLHLTLPEGRSVTVTHGQLYPATHGQLHPAQTKWPTPEFEYPAHWALRHRQAGDRVRLPGGTRKLSDVLTDAHVPREQRDYLWLLAAEKTVYWVGTQTPVWAAGIREQLGVAQDSWHSAMGEALALARQAAAASEVPIGAVVLASNGQIIGRGHNTCRQAGDMTQHAELAALRSAAQTLGTPYLTGCTLVVTLEPCPMCLGATLEARVGRIVYGASNPRAGALGGVTDLLMYHWGQQPEIIGAVRATEATRLLQTTFEQFRQEKN